MPVGRTSSGLGSVPPAPNFSFLISKGNVLRCVALLEQYLQGRAGPVGFPAWGHLRTCPHVLRGCCPLFSQPRCFGCSS